MSEHLDYTLAALDRLIARGRELHDSLTTGPAGDASRAPVRVWQKDCEALVAQLSGGSKAHWLSRAYSHAFLLRSSTGGVVETAAEADIVDRVVDVLRQAVASLSQLAGADIPIPSEPQRPRRFEFVHNPDLRPVLEQVFADSRAALDSQDYGRALLLASGVLEAIITDALGNRDQGSGIGDQGTARFADSSFDARIAAAEAAGLIRGGCARLPAVARQYREFTEPDGTLRPGIDVSERDARVTGQVLQVVMRDLNPGR